MSRGGGTGALVYGFCVFAVAAASGCGGGYPQPLSGSGFVADLEVSWSIAGSTDPVQCDEFGIDFWTVTATGPESRQVDIDCRSDVWDTLSDFSAIAEGNYQITVDAIRGGGILATQGAAYQLIDTGGVQPIHVEFVPGDFPP